MKLENPGVTLAASSTDKRLLRLFPSLASVPGGVDSLHYGSSYLAHVDLALDLE